MMLGKNANLIYSLSYVGNSLVLYGTEQMNIN